MSTSVAAKPPAGTSSGHGDAKVGAYPEYKGSEVDWVGELPAHWDEKRFKHLFRIKKEIAGKLGFDVLSITQRGIRVKDVESGEGQVASDYSKYQIVKAGDFAMNHMDLLTGFVDLSRQDGVTSPDYRVFALEDRASSKPYYLYLLQLCYTAKIFYPLGQGAAHVGRWRLPAEAFNDFRAPRPPLAEQVAIAKYLDCETARIDNLITEKQNFINLLKEKRQALISHVVTKGLDPKAKMKDSGIEWIGEVPEHWSVLALGKVTLSKCDGPFGSGLKSEHYTEHGVRVVRLQNIKMGYYLDGKDAFIDEDYYRNELRGHDVLEGDVLIAGLGDPNNPVGRACVAPVGILPAMVKADCFRFRVDIRKAMPAFVAHQLSSGSVYDAGVMSTGATRARIPLNMMATRKIAIGPLREQEQILEYLRTVLPKMDSLLGEVEESLELLSEHRTALISAAVTGKIDVRD